MLDPYPLDLIEGDLIRPPVVELGRTAAGVIGSVCGLFQCAAILQRGDV